MQPHPLPFVSRQRRGLLPYPDRDRDASHIVHQCCPPKRHDVGGRETAPRARCAREARHSGRVAHEVRGGEVGEVAHRRECAVDRLAVQRQPRTRLARERLFPRRPISIEREDLRRFVREPRGDRRIERAACSLAHDTRGELVTAKHALEGGVSRHVSDPHRQRDLVVADETGFALAIPTLGEMREQRLNRRGQAEPVRSASAPPRRARRYGAGFPGLPSEARARPERRAPAASDPE